MIDQHRKPPRFDAPARRSRLFSGRGMTLLACWWFLQSTGSALAAVQVHDETPISLSGFSVSQAYEVVDDEPLKLDAPVIRQLLYRIQKSSPRSRGTYSRFSASVPWSDLVEHTEDYRFWVFDRAARLKRVERYEFPPEASDDQLREVTICHCETASGEPFITIAISSPNAIPIAQPVDEPIRISGFLYARAVATPGQNAIPVFVADRIGWYPERFGDRTDESAAPGTNAALITLAQHGFDVGLLDLVRESNTQKLGNRDAEAFFQMIASVQSIPLTDVQPQIEFADLMRDSADNIGNAVRIKGVARSCTPVQVADQDIRDRLGVEQYYQLMIFPNLDGGRIVVKNKQGDDLVYHRFPITVCCLNLPAGMSPEDVAKKPFEVEGFFFRFWKYQSKKTDQAEVAGQLSPLIIARTPILLASDESQLNTILFWFAVVIVVGIVVMLAVYRIADRRHAVAMGDDSLPEKVDFSRLRDLDS